MSPEVVDNRIAVQQQLLAQLQRTPSKIPGTEGAKVWQALDESAQAYQDGSTMSLDQARRVWDRLLREQEPLLRKMLRDFPDARSGGG